MSDSLHLNFEDRAAIIDRKRCPLVLLHAFPVGPQMWGDVVELLAGRNLVVDLPGFGATPIPDGEPNLDDAADALARTLDLAGIDRAVIAGLSMGGYVALSFAERHPERLSALALLNTNMHQDPEEKRQERREMIERVRADGARALSADALLGKTTRATQPLVVSSAQELAHEANPEGIIWALEAMAIRPERTYVARELDVPVLVLTGDEDDMSPLSALTDPLAEKKDVTAVTISGAGHLSAMEQPQAVARALEDLVSLVS